MHPTIRLGNLGMLVLGLAACGSNDEDAPDGPSSTESTGAGAGGPSTVGSGGSTGSTGPGASTTGTGGGGAPSGDAGDWIIAHFADAPVVTGDFDQRIKVETPALVRDATGCCAKYAFDAVEEVAPDDRQIGFVDVTITDLQSTDAFGGGIATAYADGAVLFLSNVRVEPNWPTWVDYATTNYDGLVLDGSSAIYAEDLVVENWNADGAIDNKAEVSQFVRLTIAGQGNRGIRYWKAGPHYIIDSQLENSGGAGEGSLLWFSDCDLATVNIYASTFNGSATVPPELISCDNGTAPTLNYLTTDPRTTGEMHEMFSP